MSEPEKPLTGLVLQALGVESRAEFDAWQRAAHAATDATRAAMGEWQQFVVRMQDERGDPIRDFQVELFTRGDSDDRRVLDFDVDVHAYRADPSLRCFHVSHDRLRKGWGERVPDLWVRLIASSGTELVGYHGVSSERIRADGTGMNREGAWDAEIAPPKTFGDHGVKLFHPFTTTFVEVTLNRDPITFDEDPNRVRGFGAEWFQRRG